MELKFKNERVNHLVTRIKDLAVHPIFKGKVYFSGECVRNSMLGGITPQRINLSIDVEDGGGMFATFIAMKTGCFKEGTNPMIDVQSGTAYVKILSDDKCNDMFIVCSDVIKSSVATNKKDRHGTISTDYAYKEFTMDALYLNAIDGKLYDPSKCAIKDIKEKTVRSVITPSVGFKYYPIRIMKAIRIAGELGFGIEKDTWLGIIKNAHLVYQGADQQLSMVEFSKMLTNPLPSVSIRRLRDCGALRHIAVDLADIDTVKYQGSNLFDFTMKCLDITDNTIEARLAVLFHGIGNILDEDITCGEDKNDIAAELAEYTIRKLGYNSSIGRKVSIAIRHFADFSGIKENVDIPERKIKRFMSATKDALPLTIELMSVTNLMSKPKKGKQALTIAKKCEEIAKKMEEDAKYELPIDGNDIIREFHLSRGKLIGTLLNEVKKAFKKDPTMDRVQCLDIVEATLSKIS